MLDYRMHTFLTLCDTMNYRVTAEQLNMTQPAVTQHIHYLEREYQCKLFHYDGKRLTKSFAAHELEQYARAAAYNENAIKQHLTAPPLKTIKMGATKTIGDFVVGDMVVDFLMHKPHSLSLVVDNTEHLLFQLDHNALDFALVEGVFDKQKYGYRLFRREPFVGICACCHRFAGKKIRFEDLFSETLIIREKGSGTRGILTQILQENGFSSDCFARQICISSFELIQHIVSQNIGISFVYEAVAKSNPALSIFTLEGFPIAREFNYVFLKKTAAQHFIAEFDSNFEIDNKNLMQ